MRPHIILISALLFLLTLGLVLFLAATSTPPAGTIETTPGELTRLPDEGNPFAELSVPDFELIDRNAQPITHATLDGQLTVIDFFFTSCPLFCPGMTGAMVRVQNATQDTPVRFMSISIDGDLDTPDIIDQYANRYGADPDRWAFATGDPAYVANLVKTGLKFEIGGVSDTPQTGGREINHPTRLILLGPDRRVIGLYRYEDPQEVDALIAKIKELTN